MRPPRMSSDTGVDMRPVSSGNSRPALARNLTPPRNFVAELTSAFLFAELGVQGQLRHSGYIDHWIKLLKSDPRAIFTAASKASQSANYLRLGGEE
jgi:antirestriction protein ArdC